MGEREGGRCSKGKDSRQGKEEEGLIGAAGTHFSLIDEQHHVGEGVQGHVHRQLHRAGVADAAPGSRP